MAMDAIEVLTADHRRVEELFTSFEQAGPRAAKTKRRIVDELIEALSVHASIEETVFYPAVRHADPTLGDQILESLEEHHGAKTFLAELERMAPQAERFDAKVKVLTEQIRHHVAEEESELFPAVRRVFDDDELDSLGEALVHAKEVVPNRPHPHQPDTPPFNVLLGLPVAVADRVIGAARSLLAH